MIRMGSSEGSAEAMAGEERLLSIVLSTSELAKLDLSSIQLFQDGAAHRGFDMHLNQDPLIFKSRGAIEAEKTQQQKLKKAESLDETELETKTARDRRPPPIPGVSRTRNAEPSPEAKEAAGIDLKSSPASKFLIQSMPWDLQPSPVTPFTPAAVPFKWEEAPGKPKARAPDNLNGCPVLHLPPRLLQIPSQLQSQSPPKESGARHGRSASYGSAEEKRVISVEPLEKLEDRSPGCLISSLDLGPPPRQEELHRGANASALVAMWRKNSSAKNNGGNKSKGGKKSVKGGNKSLNPRGELLMGAEEQGLWAKEADQTRTRAQSLNVMIAAAMTAKSEDLAVSNGTAISYPCGGKNLGAITEVYSSNFVEKKRRRRRKGVLRKLRRPARLFKAFFAAVWRAVWLRKSIHRSRGNVKCSYQSLRR